MDLTDRQRKLLFAGLVVVLALVGVYLTLPNDDGPTRRTSNRSAEASAPVVAPSTPPPGIDSTINPQTFDIYRLLPFTQREFATAADIAQRFIATYGTYRYDEDPKVYVGRLSGMVFEQLRSKLDTDSSAPGQLEERKQQRVVSESTASLDSIRDIQANSMVFLVTCKQKLTKSGATSQESNQYAVTMARDAAAWRVYAFELADVGQEGDVGGR